MYVKYLLQNRFAFFISLFDLSAILKIRNGEHVYYVGLVVAYTWNREKQMFVALGKEFDMLSLIPSIQHMYVANADFGKKKLFPPFQAFRGVRLTCAQVRNDDLICQYVPFSFLLSLTILLFFFFTQRRILKVGELRPHGTGKNV